jgi:hypothetical protein
MKLSRLFMIALLVGTLGVIGCGDDSSSGNGNGNGTGGTPSNGSVCDDCENQSDIGLCEAAYDRCKDLPSPNNECVIGSLALCEIV